MDKTLEADFDTMISISHNFEHIPYAEKVLRSIEELQWTDPEKIMNWGWEEWDSLLGGIYWGKIYLIGAETGIGKTTFVNQVCRNVGKTWVRVVKYSLEDRMEDIGKEELFYEINRGKFQEERYERTKFVNNEYWTEKSKYYDPKFRERLMSAWDKLSRENIVELDKKKQVNIDELIYLMEEECDNWAKLFAIDHLHYFEFEGTKDRLDLQIQNVMQRINEVARRRNVAVLLVAHYRNTTGTWEPDPIRFKDWASIKQVANVIIQIVRDDEEGKSYFHITKLRWPIKKTILETTFDLYKFEYAFKKTDKQAKKEALHTFIK